jgi:predicted ATPase
MTSGNQLQYVAIQGYRPFRDFRAELGALEVLVGANGSGKSSLFEFLRLLRDGLRDEIPPEIVPGAVGQQVFHMPGAARLSWQLAVGFGPAPWVRYEGELLGPVGRPQVIREHVASLAPPTATPPPPEFFMKIEQGRGLLREKRGANGAEQEIVLRRLNRLALGSVTNPELLTLYMLREYILGWRFYGAYGIAGDRMRRAVPVQQEPVLAEDGSNLAAVLHYLLTEHQPILDELQQHLAAAVPGFRGLTVKARGGPGEVMAFWREVGVDGDLSLADLSDGLLRLICWMVLCLHPTPPSVICIDEPDQGVHPRTLPILAGLFEKACERTQLLVATHSSYFLTQFDLSRVAVLRKEDGEAKFLKPYDSDILRDMLVDFGPDEVERLHRSDELERLA